MSAGQLGQAWDGKEALGKSWCRAAGKEWEKAPGECSSRVYVLSLLAFGGRAKMKPRARSDWCRAPGKTPKYVHTVPKPEVRGISTFIPYIRLTE
jgi:hypothetical protein